MNLFFLLVYLIVGTHVSCVSGKRAVAAIWLDDGSGQTVKAELPPNESKVLKRHMLDIFGIEGVPRNALRHRHSSAKGSASKYMKEIYDALDERGHAPQLGQQYEATVGAADTIITFVNKAAPIPRHPGSNRQLYFDLMDVSPSLHLIEAELRVHRTLMAKPHSKDLLLNIYKGAKDKDQEFTIAQMPLPQEGWLTLNVTQLVSNWIMYPENNLGLRISVTVAGHKHEIGLHEAGVTGAHGQDYYRPFLVGFFMRPEGENSAARSRKIRSISPTTDYKNPYLAASFPNVLSDQPKPTPDNLCQKRPLHVSFKDLGWQAWVIAPEGYDANFCDGKCQFPILSKMNATNHAIIQTLVKMKNAVKNGDQLPPDACCAPKDLTTISVLYINYAQNVVLKKYPKMIVKTCGCF